MVLLKQELNGRLSLFRPFVDLVVNQSEEAFVKLVLLKLSLYQLGFLVVKIAEKVEVVNEGREVVQNIGAQLKKRRQEFKAGQ